MSIYFFDTCALKHRYLNTPQRRRVRRVTSDPNSSCYICDWTIVEIAGALGDYCRGQGLGIKKFNQMDNEFFEDVASGKLTVLHTSTRGIMQARSVLRKGVAIRRHVGSGDALIASCCRELALELKKRVVFYTADWGLYTLLRDIDSFTSVMTLRYILLPRHGIPAET